jgi:excisionase family DNA binding protein
VNEDDRALTVDEVARYLGLAKGTIYNKVHRREIPFFKVGRAVRFRRSKLDEWLRTQQPITPGAHGKTPGARGGIPGRVPE